MHAPKVPPNHPHLLTKMIPEVPKRLNQTKPPSPSPSLRPPRASFRSRPLCLILIALPPSILPPPNDPQLLRPRHQIIRRPPNTSLPHRRTEQHKPPIEKHPGHQPHPEHQHAPYEIQHLHRDQEYQQEDADCDYAGGVLRQHGGAVQVREEYGVEVRLQRVQGGADGSYVGIGAVVEVVDVERVSCRLLVFAPVSSSAGLWTLYYIHLHGPRN